MTNITHQQNEQLISEAVVASYIRDISGHHRRHQTANQRALYELRRPAHRRRGKATDRPRT